MNKLHLRGPGGILVTLDRDEFFPDDPGNGTPCMVRLFQYTGTLTMAANEGELNSSEGDKKLTEDQGEWLNSIEDDCWAWIEGKDSQAAFRLQLKVKP